MIESKQIPWLEILDTVFRRRWTIALVASTVMLMAIAASITSPRVYKATSTIQLSAEPVTGGRVVGISDQVLQAEMSFMRSPSLIKGVLEEYAAAGETDADQLSSSAGLKVYLQSIADKTLGVFRDAHEPSLMDRKSALLAEQIETARVDRSNVVHISFHGQEPVWAARFVNDLLRHHVDRIADLREKSGARSFFERQAELLAERRKRAAESLLAYRREQGNFAETDEASLRGIAGDLEAKRVATETQVLELQAKIDYLIREMELFPQTIAAEEIITEDESVRFLKSRLLELEVERSDLLSKYTPTSKLIQNIERQIEETEVLLAEKGNETLSAKTTAVNPAYQALEIELLTAQSQLTASRARHEALIAQLVDYRAKLVGLEDHAGELDSLEGELQNARKSHESYLSEMESARLVSALDESRIVNLIVVEEAQPPIAPEPTRAVIKIFGGALLGFLLGVAIAFLKDSLDPSVKNSYQVARLSGLPVMAQVTIE